MIVVKFLGGLGNQLFQYAYGSALAADHGYHVKFDKESLIEGTHREYSLGFLGELVPLTVATAGPRISENGMRFNPEYLKPKDPSTIYGYWQTEKYFPKDAERLRRVILGTLFPSHTTPVSYAYADIWRKIHRSEAIAVHVRRQDYVQLQAFHGIPGLDYYRNAIKLIRERHYGVTPFVFSDDRQWCRENFPSDFHVVEGTNKYEDLRLMTVCKHAVIANSSFSWWGAWLGDNQRHRTIIAPKQWFADPTVDSTDIVPERWIKL